jgi:hypothetical protein
MEVQTTRLDVCGSCQPPTIQHLKKPARTSNFSPDFQYDLNIYGLLLSACKTHKTGKAARI